ncbi:MAG: sensor histidine kinase [Emticicia sp.]|uniref:sensor histidine kinase n=1 Tax=Emticicia sp. TaxID=1930953 RepID=UPI003BA63F2A
MKFYYQSFVVICLLIANNALAVGDTLRLTDNKSSNLYEKSYVLVADNNQTLESVKKNTKWLLLKPDFKPEKNKTIWLHFFVENETDATQPIFIRNPDNEISEYYVFENKKLINKLTNGEFISTWGMNENHLVGVDSFSIKGRKTIEVFIKASNYQGLLPFLRLFPQKNLRISYFLKTEKNQSRWFNQYYLHNLNELQIRVFYQGGLGVIFIIILLIYNRNRSEKLYRYYLFYVLSAFAFTLIKSRSFTYVGKIVGIIPIIKIHGGEAIMWLGFAAYLVFIAELLDLHKNQDKLYQFIKITSKAFIFYGIGIFLWLILTNDSGLQAKLFIVTRIPLILVYIGILVFTAKKVRSSMVKYVLVSNGILIVFGLIAWLKAGFLNQQVWYGIFNHLFTLPFAILLEIIVFALAIAKKIGDERQAKNALEKKAIEVEMMALRSQMNPHFVFNSLNTVRYFVLSDQKEKAKNYLAKFSKLLRTILSYSKENTISLRNELEAIKLYIDVELGRFESNFFYSINIDEEIELDSVMIPPLLLQPFVENAIIHGLRNSDKTERILAIKVSQTYEKHLEISIVDNGVGRTKANEIQYKQDVLHKSFGTTITNQRIELFNQSYAKQIKVETIDLVDESGTKVIIQIKI